MKVYFEDGKSEKNFVSDCLEKGLDNLDVNKIDDYVEYWHTHDTNTSLREFLGFAEEEYRKWVTNSNDVIKDILNDRLTEMQEDCEYER